MLNKQMKRKKQATKFLTVKETSSKNTKDKSENVNWGQFLNETVTTFFRVKPTKTILWKKKKVKTNFLFKT